MSEKEQLSLEEAFERLESVIDELEKPQTSLDDSFKAYKEGMELVKQCNAMIDKVEKDVKVLSEGEENDGF